MGELVPTVLAAAPEDELCRVLRRGEVDERGGDVAAGHLVVFAADLLEQLPVLCEQLGARPRQAVLAAGVDAEQLAVRSLCDARGAPDEVLGSGRARDGDDDAFTRLPRLGDPVAGAVILERDIDLVRDPQQRELSKGGEVALSEVVRQGGVDLLGRVHVAVRHAPPQRFGRHVDQLHLVGRPDDRVGDRLALHDPGDALDHVVDRFEMLDVDGRDDVDAGVEELVHVLPPLGVPRAGSVGVGELVDEGDLRVACEDGVDVHLLERCRPVLV